MFRPEVLVSTDELLEVARRLTAAAALAPAQQITRIPGGRNNRVFRVETADGGCYAMKIYFYDESDPRDRLSAEWSFLHYAIAHGVTCTPRPLAREHETRSALYSFVTGRKPAAAELTAAHVEAAAKFVATVNSPPKQPFALGPGSEACFSLAEHVRTIERRVARLSQLDPNAPFRDQADALVKLVLEPCWMRIRERIIAAEPKLGGQLAPEQMCLSPSDFGFHNVLVDGDAIVFIDFEYAGRDDPAKLVCDFFNQPEVPVPRGYFDLFTGGIGRALALTARDIARCDLLLDAYCVKWACIMLNDFLPIDRARRAFALPGGREQRCRDQLAKAEASLARLANYTAI